MTDTSVVFCIDRIILANDTGKLLQARINPIAEFSSSNVPNALINGASLYTRLPWMVEVVPSSPVWVSGLLILGIIVLILI